jgi:hypothetical protein
VVTFFQLLIRISSKYRVVIINSFQYIGIVFLEATALQDVFREMQVEANNNQVEAI